MAAAAIRRISETIIDFGEPLLAKLAEDDPLEVVRDTVGIVVTVWNAHVMASPRWGQPQFLAALRQSLLDPDTPPLLADAVRQLSRRRRESFAADLRAVGEWSIVEHGGQWRLRCDVRVPIEVR
jgi:hypothetical protein